MTLPPIIRPVLPLLIVGALGLTCTRTPAPPDANAGQDSVKRDPTAVAGALAAAVAIAGARLPAEPADDLVRLYERTPQRPLWIDGTGNVTPAAREALAMLAGADSDGLDPNDYAATELNAAMPTLAAASPAAAADFDARLSAGVLLFYRHLHMGRVDPRTLGLEIAGPREGHDFAERVLAAATHDRLAAVARALMPPYAQYGRLRGALSRYRALAALPTEPVVFAETLHPGDTSVGLPALRRLLLALGDLPAAAPDVDDRYDGALVDAVRRYQARHGIDADGVIGSATQAALAVPLAWRVRQIELALERIRWLPDFAGGRVIAVNIPMFHLWAWDHLAEDEAPALSMKVVVGRVVNRTPVFADQLEHVVFRPYWNVPASILRNEMLPAIARDPAYLARQNLEIVRGPGDRSPVLSPTPEHVNELGRNGVRLRQRPGPSNALGRIKFIFPNSNDVYLHDTPATQLFSRSRRDFSHGCIRVEEPAALAEWVLSELPGWSRERVDAAMNGAPNVRVDLPEPIQVVIFYTTAVVDFEGGAVHFADDIYGHDAVLDKAL